MTLVVAISRVSRELHYRQRKDLEQTYSLFGRIFCRILDLSLNTSMTLHTVSILQKYLKLHRTVIDWMSAIIVCLWPKAFLIIIELAMSRKFVHYIHTLYTCGILSCVYAHICYEVACKFSKFRLLSHIRCTFMTAGVNRRSRGPRCAPGQNFLFLSYFRRIWWKWKRSTFDIHDYAHNRYWRKPSSSCIVVFTFTHLNAETRGIVYMPSSQFPMDSTFIII